jgi:NitT/TauT family transport system substrate-binding protein
MLAMLAIAQTGCEREAAKEDQKRAATSPATTRTASGGDATPEEEKEEVSPVDVKLGLAISSYVHAIGWIARDAGEFERNGVTPTIEVMGGSAATMRALIGGSIDVGLAGGDSVLKARAAGADVVVVAGFVNRFYHRIVGGEDVKTMADLEGKKVGLGFLGGPQDTAVKVALADAGLVYGKNVEILNLGKEFNRMAALRGGDIDATTSQTPPSKLKEMGLHVLADLPATDAAFPYAMLIVKRDYLEKNREGVARTLASLCAASEFYRNEKDRSLAIISENIKGSDTKDAARERYEISGPNMISLPPVPDVKGFETVVSNVDFPDGKKPDIAAAIDTSVLEELQAKGKCVAPGSAPE